MPKYTSIQFAPDGDYITDYQADTIDEIEQLCADQGSRWYFFPFQFVITDNGKNYQFKEDIMRKRAVSASYPFEDLKGLSIKRIQTIIRETEWKD